MFTKTLDIDFKDLVIKPSVIEEILGYKEGENRDLVSGSIEEILKECHDCCCIKAEYKVFENVHFDNETKSIIADGLLFDVKKTVFSQLKNSDSAALYLCTAGPEIGIRSRKKMDEGDFLQGYIYDVIGSEIVEAASDIMQEDLRRHMSSSGKKITNRYSPGYCGWDVAEQHILFKLFPENYCGIRLTESALMYPVKSVSGIIGIGKTVKNNPYTCGLCNLTDCVYRRVRQPKP